MLTRKEINEHIETLLRERCIAIGKLTEKQAAEAIRQAFACGDFERLVRVDGDAQSVTYIPFRREEELLAKIKELQSMVPTHTGRG